MPVRLAAGIRYTTTPATIVCTTSFVAGRKPRTSSIVAEREHQAGREEEGHSGRSGAAHHRGDGERADDRAAAEQGDGFPVPAVAMGFATTPTRRARIGRAE